jgi:SAM-dependent methyltransferase
MSEESRAARDAARRAYDLAAERYHDLYRDELRGKEYDRKLLDAFAGHFDRRSLILDAGCGPSGHIGRYVFDQGVPVLGLDISGRCVELARLHNPRMAFERGDLGELPFLDASFDGIIAFYSILHSPKSAGSRIFAEFHRALKPGGRLLVAVKAGASEGYLPEALGFPTPVYFSLFTLGEIEALYQSAGFSLELLEKRAPYDTEIDVERIYAVGRK